MPGLAPSPARSRPRLRLLASLLASLLVFPVAAQAQEIVEPPIPGSVPARPAAAPAPAPVASARVAPPAAPASALPSPTPEPEVVIDPSAVRECGMRVRKAGISVTALGFIIGATGAALLFDGANHPQDAAPAEGVTFKPKYGNSRAERNAGYALVAIGAVVTIPGIYLWVKGQSTISEVDRKNPAGGVKTSSLVRATTSLGPTLLPGGGGLSWGGKF